MAEDEHDIIEETRKHIAENPVTEMMDKIAGRVLDAADEVDRRIGPLSDKEYAIVVAILADRAVMQLAVSARKHGGKA